jgi:hypothetical protein
MSEMRHLAVMREWGERIKRLPPVPRAILTDQAVPFGRAYRQWDTNGDLWVYANPGEVADLPRRIARTTWPGDMPLFGIPVRPNRRSSGAVEGGEPE